MGSPAQSRVAQLQRVWPLLGERRARAFGRSPRRQGARLHAARLAVEPGTFADEDEDDRPFDADMHSRCFCTLEGLFAVDWSVGCASSVRSGWRFCPTGPVKQVARGGSYTVSHIRGMTFAGRTRRAGRRWQRWRSGRRRRRRPRSTRRRRRPRPQTARQLFRGARFSTLRRRETWSPS